MFAFSTLFAATATAHAFNVTVARQAASGRVPQALCDALSAENERRAAEALPLIELDLTDKSGRPLGKPAFLRMADKYRACKGKGVLRGHVLQATWGSALDHVALLLHTGTETPTPDHIAALTDAGQYMSPAAWEAATKPAPKAPKAPAPAPEAGAPSPVSTDNKSPAQREAQAPGAVAVSAPAPAPAATVAPAVAELLAASLVAAQALPVGEAMELDADAPELYELGADELFDATMTALAAGVFDYQQLQALAAAVAEAQQARTMAVAAELAPV